MVKQIINKLKVFASPQNDLKVIKQALDVYDVFRKQTYHALKNPKEFVAKGQDQNPIRYMHNTDKHSDTIPEQSIYTALNTIYANDPELSSLIIILGLVDSPNGKFKGAAARFTENAFSGGYHSLILYMYNDDLSIKRGFFSKNKLPFNVDQVIEQLKNDSGLKNVFVHEFGHFKDYMRSHYRDPENGDRIIKYPDPGKGDTIEDYINHPLEYNAQFYEIVNSIIGDLDQYKDSIKDIFPTFQKFFFHYWSEPGFFPETFKEHISDDITKRTVKRLYKLYEYITKDEDYTKQRALKIVQGG